MTPPDATFWANRLKSLAVELRQASPDDAVACLAGAGALEGHSLYVGPEELATRVTSDLFDLRWFLRSLEWRGAVHCYEGQSACPSCLGTQEEGHAADCRLDREALRVPEKKS